MSSRDAGIHQNHIAIVGGAEQQQAWPAQTNLRALVQTCRDAQNLVRRCVWCCRRGIFHINLLRARVRVLQVAFVERVLLRAAALVEVLVQARAWVRVPRLDLAILVPVLVLDHPATCLPE